MLLYVVKVGALVAPLVVFFAALDLLGNIYPYFSSPKWGSFAEWALALVTPIAVFTSVDQWNRQRREQRLDLDAAKSEAALGQARKAEALLAGVRVTHVQGVHGSLCYVQNDSKVSVTVLRTQAQGTLAHPIFIPSRDGAVMPNSPPDDDVVVATAHGEFRVSRLGVKWLCPSTDPQNQG